MATISPAVAATIGIVAVGMLGGFLQPVKGVRTLDPGLDACDDVFGQRKLVHRDLLEQRR